MTNLRNALIRLAHEKPELQPHLLPLVKMAATVKDYGKLNMMSELSVRTLESSWSDEDEGSGPGQPLYDSRVVFSAKIEIRQGMGRWVTFYSAKNIEGRIFSDPGGGFYLLPTRSKFSRDPATDLLVSDILNEIIFKNQGKLI